MSSTSTTTSTTTHHHDHESTTDSTNNTSTTSTNSTAVLAYPLNLDSPAQQSLLQLSLFPITLKFVDVAYKVRVEACNNEKVAGSSGSWWPGSQGATSREKTILTGLSGMVSPGELLGLLGPSGSGKTTLLTALAGRSLSGKLSGKISYNARAFSGSVKRRTGFVPQNDVLYPHLTVSETLLFTALLRLPESLTRPEKAAHVDRVVAELGLSRCRDTIIGGPLLRGISGGEKKRVSIGQEMLINPSLLLLDEPTSGLDSTAAQWILTTLKNLAAAGRTVVTTIHQPSSRLYHMFDKVLLLSEGCPLYYGPASRALDHFSEAGFSSPLTLNPADLMLDLANGISPAAEQPEKKASVKEALVKAYDEKIRPGLRAQLAGPDTELSMKTKPDYQYSSSSSTYTSWWHQFAVLLQRGIKERRHETFNQLRIFQVVSVASLGGLLWWQTPESNIGDRVALLFFFSVFWGFYPLYNAVFTFPQERAMLVKERSSGMYRLSSYFLAKTVGDLPLELALPTAFVSIIYWMGGLDPRPGTFLLTLLVVLYSVLVSQSLGLAIGAVLMDIKKATTLASVTTLVFLMAGGYYVQHIPPFIVWLKYVSYSYYCYKLLLGVHYAGPHRTYDCGPGPRCRVADFPAVKSMALDRSPWLDVFYMFLMLVGYRFLAYLALRRLRLR